MRCLLRLFPREWCERYGSEFLALLEEEPLRLRTVVDVVSTACRLRFESATNEVRLGWLQARRTAKGLSELERAMCGAFCVLGVIRFFAMRDIVVGVFGLLATCAIAGLSLLAPQASEPDATKARVTILIFCMLALTVQLWQFFESVISLNPSKGSSVLLGPVIAAMISNRLVTDQQRQVLARLWRWGVLAHAALLGLGAAGGFLPLAPALFVAAMLMGFAMLVPHTSQNGRTESRVRART